jgi:phage terminase large subunit-like protein
MTVDYAVIEKYVFDLESKYGVSIQALGYDRYNALSSAQKWEQRYNTVEIRQHSDTLHMPTKFLKERILDKKFRYVSNRLYEANFENARCTYDTGLRLYVNKKKSSGKVDAAVATIDAVYLLQQDIIFGVDGFIVQTA